MSTFVFFQVSEGEIVAPSCTLCFSLKFISLQFNEWIPKMPPCRKGETFLYIIMGINICQPSGDSCLVFNRDPCNGSLLSSPHNWATVFFHCSSLFFNLPEIPIAKYHDNSTWWMIRNDDSTSRWRHDDHNCPPLGSYRLKAVGSSA